MKRLSMTVVVGVIVAALASGCSQVHSSKPIGLEPVSLQADEWEGTWQIVGSAGVMTARVTNAEAGELELASISEEDGKFKLSTIACSIRKTGDTVFANLYDPESSRYLWVQLKKDDDRVVCWVPDYERIAPLVEQGRLPAKHDKDNRSIVLGDLNADQQRLLVDPDRPPCVQWQEPIVLQRLGK
ncbi:MAG: hypothetical protein D6741_09845 [Planctomycetota bacterium]|nr:MAG: hypothetical protein D6741_09845 [Planctomycetota bacterium]